MSTVSGGDDSESEPATDSERVEFAVRTAAERDAFAAGTYYARVYELGPPPEAAYLDALPSARRDVLFRLVGGVCREAPAELVDPVLVGFGGPDPPRIPEGDRWPAVDRRTLADWAERADEPIAALLSFPASGAIVSAPVAAVHGYDRYRLAAPIGLHTATGTTRIDHPVDLVGFLEREGAFVDATQAERIEQELAESVANLALARLARRMRDARSGSTDEGSTTGGSTTEQPPTGPAGGEANGRERGRGCEAVAARLAGADPTAALERLVTDGHPFHVGGKIRRGMGATEGLSYAPEFAPEIALRFVAVENDRAYRTCATDGGRAGGTETPSLTERLFRTFPGLADALDRASPPGHGPAEYAVVPMHPWQFHRTLPERYGREIDAGRIVPLAYTHPATPLLNLRTVVPYPTDATGTTGSRGTEFPHLKLAIGVQLTNVVRTLSPQAVTNGPRATDLLSTIAASEPLETLGVLREPAAASYSPPGGPHLDGPAYDDMRHCAALLRENPAAHPLVSDDAIAVPAASLLATTPDGRVLACEAIDRHARRTDATNVRTAAREFLAAYVDVTVPEQLTLLTKYGIALESHLQNSLVALEAGRPVAALVRDLGGIRVHGGRLADRGLAFEPYPDSDLDADDETDLHRKLYYALFQNHLAELIVVLTRHTPIEEPTCWRLVRERCRRAFDELRADSAVPDERVATDERALFRDPIAHKALTTMRFRDMGHEYVTSPVSNPLADRSNADDASIDDATDRTTGTDLPGDE